MSKVWMIILALGILGCNTPEVLDDEKIKVVCTTGMIADATAFLLGEHAEVKTLMGPGVDPHLYKATQGDIEALTKADLIVYNGLHLEGKMTDIFHKLSQSRKVIALGDVLPDDRLINSTNYEDAYDPHIWFDIALWSLAVDGLALKLSEEYPAIVQDVQQNAERYRDTLAILDQFVRQAVNEIPEQQRVLITAHDAFKYFGKAYGLRVMGLQGISTSSEYGLRDVSNLVKFTVENSIQAIFVESSVPKRSIEAVIEGASKSGHNLKLGGELFSDAMGAKDTPEGHYPGMVRYNVNTIVNALK